MAKISASNDTSQSIIDSTLSAIAVDGISNLTTKSISKRASISTASIHYFFDTKENLVYNSFAYMIKSIRLDMLDARKGQPDPIKRIRGVCETHFTARQLSEEAANIWPQIWSHATYNPRTARLVKIFGARMISNFTYDLRELGMPHKQARLGAIELRAMIVGLWVEKQVTKNTLQGERIAVFERMLSRLQTEAAIFQ
ncbi:MAG: TetR family transcriptional regulator C-terminal domain-containing protein [Robiginitomaculum sp.]